MEKTYDTSGKFLLSRVQFFFNKKLLLMRASLIRDWISSRLFYLNFVNHYSEQFVSNAAKPLLEFFSLRPLIFSCIIFSINVYFSHLRRWPKYSSNSLFVFYNNFSLCRSINPSYFQYSTVTVHLKTQHLLCCSVLASMFRHHRTGFLLF